MTPDTPKYSMKDERGEDYVTEKLLENDEEILKAINSRLTFNLSVEEVVNLLRAECELRLRLKELKDDFLTPDQMYELREKLDYMGAWDHHWLGGLSVVQMFGEYYVHVDDYENAMTYLNLKIDFIHRVYGKVGLNGALAWTQEEAGDLAVKHGHKALALDYYTKACDTLLHMFGEHHEYYTVPLGKLKAIEQA
jgi:hypothetical protein